MKTARPCRSGSAIILIVILLVCSACGDDAPKAPSVDELVAAARQKGLEEGYRAGSESASTWKVVAIVGLVVAGLIGVGVGIAAGRETKT